MNLPIARTDLDAFRYVCANHGLACWTNPTNNEGIVKIYIRNKNGTELSPSEAMCYGREVEAWIAAQASDKLVAEAKQEEQLNNVVAIVEPINDLP